MVTVRKLVLKYGVNRVPDKEDSQVGFDTLVKRGVFCSEYPLYLMCYL